MNTYCALADLKQQLGINDTSDDSVLTTAINAASRQIDGYCGRRFWQDPTPVVRYYHAYSHTLCETDDISTTTGLLVDVDLLGSGAYNLTLTINNDFILEPLNSDQLIPVRPWEEIHIVPFAQNYLPLTMRPGVRVTARFGWPAIPDDVTSAALLQAGQLYKAKDAVFGVAAFGDFGPIRVRAALNPIAAGLLADYRKPALG